MLGPFWAGVLQLLPEPPERDGGSPAAPRCVTLRAVQQSSRGGVLDVTVREVRAASGGGVDSQASCVELAGAATTVMRGTLIVRGPG